MTSFLKTAMSGLVLAAAAAASAFAAEPYTEAAFIEAQNQGRPILIDISATWCPTCRRQGEILDSLSQTPDFADLVILEVDYDRQRPIVREFNARMQSTLIVFRGEEETGRAVGITAAEDIDRLLRTAYPE